MRSLVVGLASLTFLLLSRPCFSASEPASRSNERVQWNPEWKKVTPAEYALTLTLGLGCAGLVLFVDQRSTGAREGVLYDAAVRSLLRSGTRSGRDRARFIGDIGYRSLLAFPFLDAAVSAWAVHGNGEVAWQMVAMDAEVMAVAGFIGILTDHAIGRARPSDAECKTNPDYEAFCGEPDAYGSFISGHTAIAAAGAGLTCAHHLNLPLYGGGAGDIAACAATSAAAVTTGVARLVNDRHWATDVTVGLVVGAASGFGIPSLFHYRRRPAATLEPTQLRLRLIPALGAGQFGGQLLGIF
ncbi:MAG TPA: phosphatase PAP2 family protein [Polyangiaceae bacterium]